VSVHAGDLQGDTLTYEVVTDSTGNGTFSHNNGTISFDPVGDFGQDLDFVDSSTVLGTFTVRVSDGVNKSPSLTVLIKRLLQDTQPSGNPDGLPDSWMTTHFGNATPTPGTSSTGDDPDNDGYTNLQEYLAGTDPNDMNSHPKITSFSPTQIQWTGQRFDYYELQASTDLKTWNTVRHVVMDGATGTLTDFTDTASPIQTFRMRRMQ